MRCRERLLSSDPSTEHPPNYHPATHNIKKASFGASFLTKLFGGTQQHTEPNTAKQIKYKSEFGTPLCLCSKQYSAAHTDQCAWKSPATQFYVQHMFS